MIQSQMCLSPVVLNCFTHLVPPSADHQVPANRRQSKIGEGHGWVLALSPLLPLTGKIAMTSNKIELENQTRRGPKARWKLKASSY